MTTRAAIRELVRVRAHLACEYCGVHETDSGDELTIDHFRPSGKGGDDSLENLVYCCNRCNQYKRDYWPPSPSAPSLWNPRQESTTAHMIEFEDQTYDVEMTFAPSARRSLVGIEPELMRDLRRIARKRQVSTQTLVNVWLRQRVDQASGETISAS